MPAVLVYRDRLLAPPESFVPRQYVAFQRLRPLFLGSRRDVAFEALGADAAILGELAGTRPWQVPLFKQLGIVPSALVRWARERDVRIVHAQFGRGGALALPLADALGVPLVVTFHGGDASKASHFRRQMFPTVFQRRWPELQRRAQKFFCVSDHVRRLLLERGVRDDLLAVHHLGVVLPEATARSKPAGSRLLCVGRFVPKKGFADAIAALRHARSMGSRLELDLIGDGPLRPELEQAAQDLPVRFLGWQSPEAVGQAMEDALALMVPSRTAASGDAEGLPTVVLEAQARGLLVVATRHAGIPEAVSDGQNGLLVPEGDPAALGDALVRVEKEPHLRAALVTAALASVRAGFDARLQSERLEQRLLALLGNS
ncbi:MAG TPA: glycosyltransferase [Geminicoccus sp.]|jgi:glycosyltransferase involved in cell wall biosynthesis|uniref:glycosyltransferase n=1 Tax=Geminicoccus sp. TaxID=2024832 RepID=UPI002E2FC227|nr:glycosyltransferase [Geminicoccus sp.]HEX2526837.1 glycosyltransferase [Geminicoccus sp.]